MTTKLCEGILRTREGRSTGMLMDPNDRPVCYISSRNIRTFNINEGDMVSGTADQGDDTLDRVRSVNQQPIRSFTQRMEEMANEALASASQTISESRPSGSTPFAFATPYYMGSNVSGTPGTTGPTGDAGIATPPPATEDIEFFVSDEDEEETPESIEAVWGDPSDYVISAANIWAPGEVMLPSTHSPENGLGVGVSTLGNPASETFAPQPVELPDVTVTNSATQILRNFRITN